MARSSISCYDDALALHVACTVPCAPVEVVAQVAATHYSQEKEKERIGTACKLEGTCEEFIERVHKCVEQMQESHPKRQLSDEDEATAEAFAANREAKERYRATGKVPGLPAQC